MIPGETVKVKIDYDLYDLNIKGLRGVYVKTLNNSKYLVYFRQNGEWAELLPVQVSRVKPGAVSKKNQNFIKRTKTMVYTYGY